MATVRNVTDGALDVPALNRIVVPDEAVECSNEVAAGFDGQPAWKVEYDERPAGDESAPAGDTDGGS